MNYYGKTTGITNFRKHLLNFFLKQHTVARYYKQCIMYLLTSDRTLIYVYMLAYKNYKYIDSVNGNVI